MLVPCKKHLFFVAVLQMVHKLNSLHYPNRVTFTCLLAFLAEHFLVKHCTFFISLKAEMLPHFTFL